VQTRATWAINIGDGWKSWGLVSLEHWLSAAGPGSSGPQAPAAENMDYGWAARMIQPARFLPAGLSVSKWGEVSAEGVAPALCVAPYDNPQRWRQLGAQAAV